MPHISSPAGLVYEALKERHARLAAKAASPDELPAWFLHLPSGGVLHVRTIGRSGWSLVSFVGHDGATALVSAAAVALTIQYLPEEDERPRGPLGFAAPSEPS